jgi:hypothetical protein
MHVHFRRDHAMNLSVLLHVDTLISDILSFEFPEEKKVQTTENYKHINTATA